MKAFQDAVEARDLAAMAACLADDVEFTSPVAFATYSGKAIATSILQTALEVFSDFRYVRVISSADGRDHALIFTAKVGDKSVTGCDFVHVNAAGLIDSFMVMVRPLRAAQALAAEMGDRWEVTKARAGYVPSPARPGS